MAKRRVKSRAKKKVLFEGRKVPALVKVISILFFISAFASFVFGVLLIVDGLLGNAGIRDLIQSEMESLDQTNSWFIEAILSSLVFGGIIILAISVLDFFVGRGLWKGKNWARIFVIVIMTLSFVSGLLTFVFSMLISDLVGVILSGLVGGYLWFSKDVKRVFS